MQKNKTPHRSRFIQCLQRCYSTMNYMTKKKPVRFTVTNNNIKQMSPDSINRWKKRRNDGTRTQTFTDANTRRHVHTHTRSLERPKLLQMYCWSSLNVVVETIIRALFVWSFMAIIVQQCDRGRPQRLKRDTLFNHMLEKQLSFFQPK